MFFEGTCRNFVPYHFAGHNISRFGGPSLDFFLGGHSSQTFFWVSIFCVRDTLFRVMCLKHGFGKNASRNILKKNCPVFSLKALLPRQLPPVPDLQLLFYDRCAGDEPRLTKEMGRRSRICRAAKGLQ